MLPIALSPLTPALFLCLLQEVEPTKGHILLVSYSASNNKLTLVEQLEVHGSVYNIAAFQVCR
jgi:hypothetical protein